MTLAVVDLEPRRVIIEALVGYVKRGWFVAPIYEVNSDGSCACGQDCGNPGKHPRLGRRYEPSNDIDQIREWWRRWPLANVGFFPGPSDLVVLDIDPRNGGDDTLADLEREFGELPECPTSLTGGGGLHLFFKRPQNIVELPSGVPGPGFEVKADKGYLILPPSRHTSGKGYAWDSGRDLADTPLPELPTWIVELLGNRRRVAPLPSDPRGPSAGLMGSAFAAAGMLGRSLGRDKAAALCPWRHEHTTGKDWDGSSVVFAPQLGRKGGWFHCSHAHCAGREQEAVLEALPPRAVEAAKRLLGVDPDAVLPAKRRPPPDAASDEGRWDAPEESPAREATVTHLADHEWKKGLRFDSKLGLTKDIGNAVLLLSHDPAWADALRFDTFHERLLWGSKPPPLPGFRPPPAGKAFSEADTAYVHHWFVYHRRTSFALSTLASALRAAARQNAYDSLTDWVTGLEWDGKRRLHRWTWDYLGTKENPYAAFVGQAWMISAIARALRPGVQADHMLILEGPQGNRKTSALEVLAGEWLLRDLPDVRNKDSLVALNGKWIVNFEELSSFSRTEWTKIKAFLTQRTDTYRPPYGTVAEDRHRRCVFSGTTNRDDYLSDETGSRRFWPVRCTRIAIDELARDRDQLWAEARAEYEKGTKWYPDGSDWAGENLSGAIAGEQSERQDEDPWDGPVRSALDARPDRNWTVGEILGTTLSMSPDRHDTKAAMRVGKILRRAGYDKRRVGGKWVWERFRLPT